MDPAELVRQYLEAFGAKDHATVRSLLDDRFSFIGPLERLDDPDALVASHARLDPAFETIQVRRLVANGPWVGAIYDMETTIPGVGTSRVSEWFEVRGAKIVSIETFFDARPFAAMFPG